MRDKFERLVVTENHIDLSSDNKPKAESEHPGSIASGGMCPCIAVGVFDRVRKRIFMIHSMNDFIEKEVAVFCDDILKNSKAENLTTWICGGQIEDSNEDDSVENDRATIETTVREKFKGSEIQVYWDDEVSEVELIINTHGKFHIRKKEHNVDDEDLDIFEDDPDEDL